MTDQAAEYEYRFNDIIGDMRVFMMLSGAVGMERGGLVYIMPPDEWLARVDAQAAEHMAAQQEDAPRSALVSRAALASERIDLLATAVQRLRADVARKDAALAEIAGVLLQRHQEGWEERLYQIARAALEAK